MPCALRCPPTGRHAFGSVALAAALALSLPAVAAAQISGESPGAGGAELDQIVIATTGATILTLILLVVGFGHRSGKVPLLRLVAAFAERRSGMPGWVALPSAFSGISLLIAVFGMYWDIALHIDDGRDAGPLANPAHYFILFGLFGIFTAGWLAIVLPLPGEDPGPTSIRIGKGWQAPLGGVLVCACGAFALIGFPLDDVWHRIFGQDVTLWGPTHLMLIGGASMTLIGMAVLGVEGLRYNAAHPERRNEFLTTRAMRNVGLTGGLLIGLSTFQAEFDFGVPQFRFVVEPVMVMIAAGVGLVAVRVCVGKGAAIGAAFFFLTIRGLLAVAVGPVLGETTPTVPLYLGSAIVVELVALRVATSQPVKLAFWTGLGLATVGLASEWAWTYVFTPIPWPATLAGSGIPFGVAAAFAGAFIGAWIGTRLQETRQPVNLGLRRGAVAGAVGIALLIGIALPKPTEPGTSATVQLRDVQGKPGTPASEGRAVEAVITLSPPDAAKEAKWFTATAWQGNGFIVDHLEEIGPGRYRTTQPIPVHGNWKALIRLHVGRSLGAIPLFLPADAAIGAKETPALPSFTREFVADHKLLQREQKAAPASLTLIAYLTVVLIAFGLLCLLVWGIHRLGKLGPEPGGPEDPARVRVEKDARHRDAKAAKAAAGGATGRPGAAT